MQAQNREDIHFDARKNSKSNKPLRQEKNTAMNKHKIEKENEISKVSNKRSRTYPTRKLEKKTMLIKQKEDKIFTTNAQEHFEKQIKDVPIFSCTICKRTCFRKNVIIMK
jgi:hypothetical protein